MCLCFLYWFSLRFETRKWNWKQTSDIVNAFDFIAEINKRIASISGNLRREFKYKRGFEPFLSWFCVYVAPSFVNHPTACKQIRPHAQTSKIRAKRKSLDRFLIHFLCNPQSANFVSSRKNAICGNVSWFAFHSCFLFRLCLWRGEDLQPFWLHHNQNELCWHCKNKEALILVFTSIGICFWAVTVL